MTSNFVAAFESVRISISVPLLVRAQGDPEEWPLWTRRMGVCRTYPLPGYRAARSERRRLMPKLLAKT